MNLVHFSNKCTETFKEASNLLRHKRISRSVMLDTLFTEVKSHLHALI